MTALLYKEAPLLNLDFEFGEFDIIIKILGNAKEGVKASVVYVLSSSGMSEW